MKMFVITFCCCISLLHVRSQVQKGAWMFGGSIGFSSSKPLTDLPSTKESTIKVTGNAGYFVMDKLAAGLQPDMLFSFFKSDNGDHGHGNDFSLGPFARYYLLSKSKRANIFVQSGFSLGSEKVADLDAIRYHEISFAAGPELFVNSSIGIQLTMGYVLERSAKRAFPDENVIDVEMGVLLHL